MLKTKLDAFRQQIEKCAAMHEGLFLPLDATKDV